MLTLGPADDLPSLADAVLCTHRGLLCAAAVCQFKLAIAGVSTGMVGGAAAGSAAAAAAAEAERVANAVLRQRQLEAYNRLNRVRAPPGLRSLPAPPRDLPLPPVHTQ